MPRSRSRSRSPRPTTDSALRHRSRSPARGERRDKDRPRRNEGNNNSGFRWKEKRKEGEERDGGYGKRLERGYRKRSMSPRRESKAKTGNSVEDKFGVADKFGTGASTAMTKKDGENTDKPPVRPAAAVPSVSTGEPMIIVHVNDRLGTKAAIPCLASDPIRLFKAMVASKIGREPHEILLKRQGERPFKDQLTLEDYGVSNGVQLDLEVDTGD